MRRSIRIKKRIAVLLSILLVLTLLPLNAGSVLAREPAFGDVDDDGKVTAADARLALHAAVGITPLAPDSSAFLAADVNETDDLTAADARLILRAAIRLDDPATSTSPPPTPVSSCAPRSGLTTLRPSRRRTTTSSAIPQTSPPTPPPPSRWRRKTKATTGSPFTYTSTTPSA